MKLFPSVNKLCKKSKEKEPYKKKPSINTCVNDFIRQENMEDKTKLKKLNDKLRRTC